MVGYIPKDENISLRIWSKGETDLKCQIRIKHNDTDYWPFFDTWVTVFDDAYQLDKNNPIYGKNIAFSGDFVGLLSADEMKGFCKSFGAVVGLVNKNTDIVVYDYGATETVKKKSESEAYHFEMMHYLDIIKLAASTNNENHFYGKNVAFAFNYNPSIRKYRYILQYLLENGANISFRYKKNTDILIDRKSGSKLKATIEAEKEGKEIITDNALIRSFGCDLSDDVLSTEYENTKNKNKSGEINPKIKSISVKVVNNKQSQGSGCIMMILALTLISAFVGFLL